MQGKAITYVLAFAIPAQALWLISGLDIAEKLGLEGVVIAVAALIVAIVHADELEAVAKELQGVDEVLQIVNRSIPTRGIGVFPDYMPEVARLVSEATESLTILCDTPAHGVFSNTAAFEEYWKHLRLKMIDSIDIECTFFEASTREKMHELQIQDDMGRWSAWQDRNRENCEAFDRFARTHGIVPTRPGGDGDAVERWGANAGDYVKSMMAVNAFVLGCFNGYEPEELPISNPRHEGPSVYIWLRDFDKEAVFVFVPVRGIGVRDFAGFHTREPALIQALRTAYDLRKEGA